LPKETTEIPHLPNFEAAIQELESLVTTMEAGDMSLEESLKAFERGVALTRHCRETLTQAEQRIRVLSGHGDNAALEPFDSAD
jgi:exodeoxyribonuclease VII small subunit